MKNTALVPVVVVERETPLARYEQRPAPPDPRLRNPVTMYLARLREGSRRTQLSALKKIVGILGGGAPERFAWWTLEYEVVVMLRAKLEASLAPPTARRHMVALNRVLKECRRLGLLPDERYTLLTDVERIVGESVSKGRELSGKEIGKLFSVCAADKTALGVRDAAVLALLAYAGLRRHEVVGALLENYDAETGKITFIGKGNKPRTLFLGSKAQEHVARWLLVRPKGPGAIIAAVSAPWREQSVGPPRAITPEAVFVILRKRAAEAKLDGRSFAAHDFRRTFISALLAKGVDISTIQQLVGHASTSTTQKYDRRGDDAKQAAAEVLSWE